MASTLRSFVARHGGGALPRWVSAMADGNNLGGPCINQNQAKRKAAGLWAGFENGCEKG
jgi:hypothetical protein